MKKKFLSLTILVMVVVLVLSFTACNTEIIYYADFTREGSVNGGGSSQSGSQSGSNQGSSQGSTTPSTPTVDGKGDGTKYNIRVWCAKEDHDMIQEMLTEYAKKYSDNDYNFTIQDQGENKVATTVLTDVNSAADVFSFASDQLGKLFNGSALMQIPETYRSQIEEQIQVAVTAATYGGEYYAIPYSYENTFLYYNKDLITDVSSLEGILSKNIDGVQYNIGISMGDSYYTTAFLYTAGMEIFGPQGLDATSVDFDNDAAKKACKYIEWLGGQDKLGVIEETAQYAALATGKVAAMISGPHMIRDFKDALGDSFAVATLPTIKLDGVNKELISFSGVKMYGVSRKTTGRDQKTTEECFKVAAYLANKENQKVRLQERDFCPTDSDLYDEAVDSGKDTVITVVNQAEFAKLKPSLIQMGNYWEPMATFLLSVYNLASPDSEWSAELQNVEKKVKGDQ